MSRLLSKKTRNVLVFIMVLALIVSAVPELSVFAKKETAAKGQVTATELYMRTGPGTDYKNIFRGDEKVLLVKDQYVSILGERNGWYHITAEFKGEAFEGYSLATFITLTEGTVKQETGDFTEITPTPTSTPSPTPTPKPESTGKGKVNADELRVRKGPGQEYEVVLVKGAEALLVRDQVVTLYGQKNGWYHLTAKVNGKKVEGYSLGTYITITKGKVDEETDVTPSAAVTPTPSASTPTPSPQPTTTATPVPTLTEAPDEPSATPIPQEVPLPAGAHKTDDGRVIDADGNELEIVTETFSSQYDVKGAVTAELLNMRESASLDAEVLAILPKDTIVCLVGTTTNTVSVNGKNVLTRWYRVITAVDGAPVRGYVLSDYVKLDYTEGFIATTNVKKQVIRKKAASNGKKIKTSKGKIVKFPLETEVAVLAEKDVNGVKWLKVEGEFKTETVTGWLLASRVDFVGNATEINFSYYRIKEKPAEVTVTATPPVTPLQDGEEDIEGANAVIKDAAALSLKEEPKYSSAVVFTDDKKPVMVYQGQAVKVIGTETDSENLWCRIEAKYENKIYTGYVNAIYIELGAGLTLPSKPGEEKPETSNFEELLANEGFPESYKPFLRELHAQYPDWVFKAYKTGLDWETVIDKESVVGENLIPNTRSVEWKSLEAGAYSWESDSFTVFDGSSWVTASRAAISYYMDPRNFLGHDTIFQFEVLDYKPSYQTKEGINTILNKTAMSGTSFDYTDECGYERTISYTEAFATAAEFSGVSPIHLASRVKQEVTIGSTAMSNSVSGTVPGYEGLYNYYNIGAYHSTEAGGAIINGLRYARDGSTSETLNTKCLISWNTRLRSIMGGAFYIGNNYINRGQNTIYLQKFNVTGTSTYNHQYMANVEAPYSEGKRMFAAYENPGNTPIVFLIPVYENMPEEPCPVPEKAYNPNNWLKTLKLYDINGDSLALTPSFSVTKDQEYSLIVGYETDYIKVGVTTVSSLATVLGDGYIYPVVGENRLVIPVKAENGDIRKYIINIIREDKSEDTPTDEPTPIPIDITLEPDTPTPTPEESTDVPEVTPEPTPSAAVPPEVPANRF